MGTNDHKPDRRGAWRPRGSALRVGIALMRYFPHGGLQRIAYEAASLLDQRGHSVRILTQDWSGERPSDSIAVELLPVPGFSNHRRASRFAKRLGATLRREPVDVLLGFDRLPGLDLYFAGDPCYRSRLRRTRSPLAALTPRARSFLRLERAVFAPGSRTRVLLMNAQEKARIQQEYGTPPDRFRVLPPGYSASRRRDARNSEQRAHERAAIRQELRAGEATVLLALGSDFHRKGFDRAVRALTQGRAPWPGVPPLLAVAGAGDAGPLRALARSLGAEDRMRWLGPREDVPALLQGADVLIHPCRSEPAGMVLLEALAAGKPVLTSAVAGYSSHVTASGAGAVLPEPFLQAELDQALLDLLEESPEILERRALSYAEGLDPGGMIGAVAEEVERL